jgi:hypothetical protein
MRFLNGWPLSPQLRDRRFIIPPCFATRWDGVSDGKETQGCGTADASFAGIIAELDALRWPRLSEQFFRVDKWSVCCG